MKINFLINKSLSINFYKIVKFIFASLLLLTTTSFAQNNLVDNTVSTSNDLNNFLIITDVHLNNNFSHKMAIEPLTYNRNNDLDLATFKKLVSTLQKNIKNKVVPKPKFILILGDLVGHKSETPNERNQNVIDDITLVLKIIKHSFPITPILYVVGNNDSSEKNYGSFEYKEIKTINKNPKKLKKIIKTYSPYVIAKNAGWYNGFLSTGQYCNSNESQKYPCILTQNITDGYYVAKIAKKFKLIALNSVIFSSIADYDEKTQKQAQQQLDWLQKQLQVINAKNETALIAMHIPAGNNIFDHSNFWHEKYKQQFVTIINNYRKNISGIVVGHTHLDEFKIIQHKEHNNDTQTDNFVPNNLMISTAGLSTSHGNTAGVKTIFYKQIQNNTLQWILYDYISFKFKSLPDSDDFTMRSLYSFREKYCKNNDMNINAKYSDMLTCLKEKDLSEIVNKMQSYYTNGNHKFAGIIFSPNDIYLN